MTKTLLVTSGLLGATAVALGAYGAHGLESHLAGAPDALHRLALWRTATHYHLPHAGMLGVVGALHHQGGSRLLAAAGGAFTLGVALFSGTLYAMALGAPPWLGAVTPVGGLSLVVGWLLLAAAALGRPAEG